MLAKTVQFLAIVFLALYLVPTGAHLIELPNKIGLDQPTYMAVQQIYRNWAFAGLVLLGALASTLLLAIVSRPQQPAFMFGLASFVLILAAAVTFFVWVLPGNQATENWTQALDNWQRLRLQWEYGHAASALLTLAALLAAVLSGLTWSRR